MENWAHRLYPKLQFEDFIDRLEVLGGKKEVQVSLISYKRFLFSYLARLWKMILNKMCFKWHTRSSRISVIVWLCFHRRVWSGFVWTCRWPMTITVETNTVRKPPSNTAHPSLQVIATRHAIPFVSTSSWSRRPQGGRWSWSSVWRRILWRSFYSFHSCPCTGNSHWGTAAANRT